MGKKRINSGRGFNSKGQAGIKISRKIKFLVHKTMAMPAPLTGEIRNSLRNRSALVYSRPRPHELGLD